MVLRRKIIQAACGTYNLLYPRITELNNAAGLDINQMIMLSALVCSLKLSHIFSELMFDYQVAVKQELNGII